MAFALEGLDWCIFCGSKVGPFKSVEHVVPESLGNLSNRHSLPKGIVCDPCNNYFASSVEGVVLAHVSFRNLRAKYRVPSKRRKIPYVTGFAFGTDIEVGMHLNDTTGMLEFFAVKEGQKLDFENLKRLEKHVLKPRPYIFPMSVDPPKKEMSRFLAKMALEAIFVRFCQVCGSEEAYRMVQTDHYDNIRLWARNGHNFGEWPYHYRAYFPEETLMEHPATKEWVQFGFGYDLLLTSRPETFFVFSYFGHEFTINLGGPSTQGYEDWLDKNKGVSQLVEKKGLVVRSRNLGGQAKNVLCPLFSV